MIHMMVMKQSWSINSYLEKYRYGWSHTEKCINMCICVDQYCCCSVVHLCLTLTHGLQHARLPCPSLSPGGHSNSCPSSQRCHPTILSSVVPFSSCLRSFPASGSFPVSQLFKSGGQNIGASASASVQYTHIYFYTLVSERAQKKYHLCSNKHNSHPDLGFCLS